MTNKESLALGQPHESQAVPLGLIPWHCSVHACWPTCVKFTVFSWAQHTSGGDQQPRTGKKVSALPAIGPAYLRPPSPKKKTQCSNLDLLNISEGKDCCGRRGRSPRVKSSLEHPKKTRQGHEAQRDRAIKVPPLGPHLVFRASHP